MKSRNKFSRLLVLIFFALSFMIIELSFAADNARHRKGTQDQTTSQKTKKGREKAQKDDKDSAKNENNKAENENKPNLNGTNVSRERVPGVRADFGRMPPKKHNNAPSIEEQFTKAGATDPITIDNDTLYQSRDGVFMNGIYLKGNANQETVPVILIHDYEGAGQDLLPLGQKLAESGMAVLIPDLRGHGLCVRRTVPDYSHGQRPVKRIDNYYTYDNFTREDYQGMLNYDGLFWYQLLYQFHNKEYLNLRKLVVIGVGFGSAVGLGWAKNDWSYPSTKTGRFVKVLIFVSPKLDQCRDFIDTMKRKRTGDTLTYLGIVGKLDEDLNKDMQKFQIDLGGKQAKLDDDATAEEKQEWLEKKRFPVYYLNTKTNGISILASDSLNVVDRIKEYINFRLQSPKMIKNFKWSKIEFEEK